MAVYRQDYGSLIEALDVASRPEPATAWRKATNNTRASHDDDRDPDWTPGVDTFEEALRLARDGDPVAAGRVDAYRHKLGATLYARIQRRDLVNDIYGDSLDIGAYCAGVPDCWQRHEIQDTTGPENRFVRIIYTAGASHSISHTLMERRGAIACALAEALEYAGARVEFLWVATNVGHDPNRMYAARILLKAYDQPLELDRLAFMCANAAGLRRIGFALREQIDCPATASSIGSGYGTASEKPLEGEEKDPAVIYFPKMLSDEPQWESTETAVAWIVERLREQGVELRD